MFCVPQSSDQTEIALKHNSCASRHRVLPLILGALTLLAVILALALPSAAQTQSPQPVPGQLNLPGRGAQTVDASQSSQADPTSQPSQAQLDREWLTSYFLVHQGYKLHHMAAIDATLNKMTPTQLRTLRDMYDQKHTMTMQQQATFNQWNAQKVAQAQAWSQRQQQQMNQISTEETQSARCGPTADQPDAPGSSRQRRDEESVVPW